MSAKTRGQMLAELDALRMREAIQEYLSLHVAYGHDRRQYADWQKADLKEARSHLFKVAHSPVNSLALDAALAYAVQRERAAADAKIAALNEKIALLEKQLAIWSES